MRSTHALNYPTVVAGAVAAATATALSSQLGLLGTILGAAIASVISAVVTNALGGWIAHLHGATRERDPLPFQRLLVGVARDHAGGARVPHRARPGDPGHPGRQLRRTAGRADRAALSRRRADGSAGDAHGERRALTLRRVHGDPSAEPGDDALRRSPARSLSPGTPRCARPEYGVRCRRSSSSRSARDADPLVGAPELHDAPSDRVRSQDDAAARQAELHRVPDQVGEDPRQSVAGRPSTHSVLGRVELEARPHAACLGLGVAARVAHHLRPGRPR